MTNRKKRLKKGIESIKEQISLHKEKREKAKEEVNIERVGYYDKELESLIRQAKEKEDQLEN